MGLLNIIFGWNYKVRKLRKKWDRLREKALKKKGQQKKDALMRLDSVSPNLVTLEEQKLGRMDRARLSKEVEINLAEIRELLKLKPEEMQSVVRSPGRNRDRVLS